MSMPNFHDLVNRLRNPGDEEVPNTIFDDLTAVYDTALEGATQRVSEKDAEIARLNGEVGRLKATNFDLLTQVSADNKPVNVEELTDADNNVTIDGLFKRK